MQLKYAFSVLKAYSLKKRFLFFSPGTCLWGNFLQIGPWCSTSRIFATVAPSEVNPMPTSLSRRAQTFGTIFTVFQHSGNDHFTLAPNQPPPREYPFQRFFSRSFHTSPRSLLHPQASHNHHLDDSHAVALVFNLNL